MPLDAYALCPGGTGMRVKFCPCCKDILSELEQIDRMLEGQQHFACLQFVEQLEKTHPERACLLATKALLLRVLDLPDQLRETVTTFVRIAPNNPLALSEWAMLAAEDEGGRRAMEILQQALEHCSEGLPGRLYSALGLVAHALLDEGQIIAARALLLLQTAVNHEDRQPLQAVVRLNASPEIPVLIKDDMPLATDPGEVPWKEEFVQAIEPMASGQWLRAADRLEALAAKVPDAAVVWRNLGQLRAWVADSEASAAALRKLASLAIPEEDAVEALATAMLLSEDPLGDMCEVRNLVYTVAEFDKLHETLLSSPRIVPIPLNPAMLAQSDEPPPKGLFMLLDRPKMGPVAEPNVDEIPRVLGQMLLYGRETDREARLSVVAVIAGKVDQVRAAIAALASGALAAEPTSETVGHMSASRDLLRADWYAGDVPEQQVEALTKSVERSALMHEWPNRPLGALDGKSPREAAPLPEYRVRLLAVLLVLEMWTEGTTATARFDALRQELGLPVPGPLDPQQHPVDSLSLVRLPRLDVARLSDEDLCKAFGRALAFRVPGALEALGQAVVDRPSLAGRDEQFSAYRLLAQWGQDLNRRLEYIDRGRKATEAIGRSSASWDLLELSLRVERGEANEFGRVMEHIHTQHIREPGVAHSLQGLLVQMGLMRPDGSPAMPAMPAAAEEPSIVVPGAQAGGESGKLWTPDSPGGGGSGGKLWTPGS